MSKRIKLSIPSGYKLLYPEFRTGYKYLLKQEHIHYPSKENEECTFTVYNIKGKKTNQRKIIKKSEYSRIFLTIAWHWRRRAVS
jgi:hypothetical protein